MHTQGKYIVKSLNSRVVRVGMVIISDVQSIASGSGLHISVPSHVTIVTADIIIPSVTLDGYC